MEPAEAMTLEKLAQMVADGFANVDQKFTELRNDMNLRFDLVNGRLDTVERRLSSMERELTNLRDDFRKVDTRVSAQSRADHSLS